MMHNHFKIKTKSYHIYKNSMKIKNKNLDLTVDHRLSYRLKQESNNVFKIAHDLRVIPGHHFQK